MLLASDRKCCPLIKSYINYSHTRRFLLLDIKLNTEIARRKNTKPSTRTIMTKIVHLEMESENSPNPQTAKIRHLISQTGTRASVCVFPPRSPRAAPFGPGGQSRPSACLGSLLHSGGFLRWLAPMRPPCGQTVCSMGGADGLLLGWGNSGFSRGTPVCSLD